MIIKESLLKQMIRSVIQESYLHTTSRKRSLHEGSKILGIKTFKLASGDVPKHYVIDNTAQEVNPDGDYHRIFTNFFNTSLYKLADEIAELDISSVVICSKQDLFETGAARRNIESLKKGEHGKVLFIACAGTQDNAAKIVKAINEVIVDESGSNVAMNAVYSLAPSAIGFKKEKFLKNMLGKLTSGTSNPSSTKNAISDR